jgi:hypothetical protein
MQLVQEVDIRREASEAPGVTVQQSYKHFSAFDSTPGFVGDLTALSERIIHDRERSASLKAGLSAINQNLPAQVYIPFANRKVSDTSVRNRVNAAVHNHRDRS